MARGKRATEVEPDETDYPSYVGKAPTDLQGRFAAWIPEVTGYDPTSAKTKEAAFNEGVRLGVALRMKFQASPENQELLEARRAAIEEAKAAPKPKAKRGRKPKEVEPEDVEPDEDDEPEEDD